MLFDLRKPQTEISGQVLRLVMRLVTTKSENYEFGNPSISYKSTHIEFPLMYT